MKKSHEKGLDKKVNETRARELTGLLKHALESIKHHEEGDQPRRSDCKDLLPLASNIAEVYEPCAKVIQQTELLEGLGDTYDIPPRRKERLVDWLTKVLFRLEWCGCAFQDVDGAMAILDACECAE